MLLLLKISYIQIVENYFRAFNMVFVTMFCFIIRKIAKILLIKKGFKTFVYK